MHSWSAKQVSFASALNGVIHKASKGGAGGWRLRCVQRDSGSGDSNQLPKGPNHAALVFPMPVLARIRPWWADAWADQAWSCQSKGVCFLDSIHRWIACRDAALPLVATGQ